MDATAKKMIEMLVDVEREIARLQSSAKSIRNVLESLGIRSKHFDATWASCLATDVEYAREHPFAAMTLVSTCKKILDSEGAVRPLSKTHVEYLARMGGYQFDTEDSKNSVDVTLRRLAKDGYCQIVKEKGKTENLYRLSSAKFSEKWAERVESFRVVERSEHAASTKADAK